MSNLFMKNDWGFALGLDQLRAVLRRIRNPTDRRTAWENRYSDAMPEVDNFFETTLDPD